jgi:hypothetical protein
MARNYNLQRRDFAYSIGDMVWYRNLKPSNKFSPKWKGPFIITAKKGKLNYAIRELNSKKKRRVNVNQIKPFVSRTEYSDEISEETPTTDRAPVPAPTVDNTAQQKQSPVPQPVTQPTTQSVPKSAPTSVPEANPTRRSGRNRSTTQVLLETLIDFRRRFEEQPSYSLVALKTQLRELLARGSVFVRSSKLNALFDTQISQLKSRVDALMFLQQITTDFDTIFSDEIGK